MHKGEMDISKSAINDCTMCRRKMAEEGASRPPLTSKKCSRCHQEKPASDFCANKRSPDGLYCQCKACVAVKDKERRIRLMASQQPSVNQKQCPCCGAVKSSEDFYRDKTAADGLQTYCKPCVCLKHKTVSPQACRRICPPPPPPSSTTLACCRMFLSRISFPYTLRLLTDLLQALWLHQAQDFEASCKRTQSSPPPPPPRPPFPLLGPSQPSRHGWNVIMSRFICTFPTVRLLAFRHR